MKKALMDAALEPRALMGVSLADYPNIDFCPIYLLAVKSQFITFFDVPSQIKTMPARTDIN